MPLYELLGSCDNVDWARRTIWADRKKEATEFAPEGKVLGREYFSDAGSGTSVPEKTYDVIMSSHVLEHLANPVRAIKDWMQHLGPSGVLVIIVPEGARMFDHSRPVTPLAHMSSDYERNVDEHDLGHLEEVISLHDLRMDRGAGSRHDFEERCRNNPANRAMHHHVFSPDSLCRLEEAAGLKVRLVARVPMYSILTVASLPGSPG